MDRILGGWVIRILLGRNSLVAGIMWRHIQRADNSEVLVNRACFLCSPYLDTKLNSLSKRLPSSKPSSNLAAQNQLGFLYTYRRKSQMKVCPHSGLLIGPTNLISCFPTTEMAEGFFSLVTTLKCEFHVKRIICEIQVEEGVKPVHWGLTRLCHVEFCTF